MEVTLSVLTEKPLIVGSVKCREKVISPKICFANSAGID